MTSVFLVLIIFLCILPFLVVFESFILVIPIKYSNFVIKTYSVLLCFTCTSNKRIHLKNLEKDQRERKTKKHVIRALKLGCNPKRDIFIYIVVSRCTDKGKDSSHTSKRKNFIYRIIGSPSLFKVFVLQEFLQSYSFKSLYSRVDL